MLIGDICTRNVIECNRKTTALELAQLMRSSHVGDVVVVDQPNGKKVAAGVVTDRDLVVQVMALEVDPTVVTAGELMGPELVTSAEANDVYETAELMRYKGVRRIPVVDENGELVGIVTLDDLLKVIGDQLTLLGRVMARERLQGAVARLTRSADGRPRCRDVISRARASARSGASGNGVACAKSKASRRAAPRIVEGGQSGSTRKDERWH